MEQKNLGVRRTGIIYVDKQSCNQQTFFQLINLLSLKFKVSKSTMTKEKGLEFSETIWKLFNSKEFENALFIHLEKIAYPRFDKNKQ